MLNIGPAKNFKKGWNEGIEKCQCSGKIQQGSRGQLLHASVQKRQKQTKSDKSGDEPIRSCRKRKNAVQSVFHLKGGNSSQEQYDCHRDGDQYGLRPDRDGPFDPGKCSFITSFYAEIAGYDNENIDAANEKGFQKIGS